MATITKKYRGFLKEVLTPKELKELFDKLWGLKNEHFPKFPEIQGSIQGFWYGGGGEEHKVDSLSDIIQAYNDRLTASIVISGKVNNNPRMLLRYSPAKKVGKLLVEYSDEKIIEKHIEIAKEYFPVKKKPIVFISYDTDELALADFLKMILLRATNEEIDVFVAKRDIPHGENPLKVMMEAKLKNAEAVIPICSVKSKESPWVWWESASVWSREKKLFPLCTNISLGDFGVPLSLLVQGREFFNEDEFNDFLKQFAAQFGIVDSIVLTDKEKEEYCKLKEEYLKLDISAHARMSYEVLEQRSDYHKYSLNFEIENNLDKAFEDILLELLFPIEYIEKKEWIYPHLKSTVFEEDTRYICLTFSYSKIPEAGKTDFDKYLYPGQKMKIFGTGGMTLLIYEMDKKRWLDRFKYDIKWKLYVDKKAPIEGSMPLNSLQYF